LAGHWLNDGVRTYLSPNVDGFETHHALFKSYTDEAAPGLRVFVPVPAYLLAMKLMAMRIDETSGQKDLPDILNLIDTMEIRQKSDLMRFAEAFYPQARVSDRVVLGIDVIWSERTRRATQSSEEKNDPPRYLGRSGKPAS
jgi:hypothetical protein